jgi:hypothetical protein
MFKPLRRFAFAALLTACGPPKEADDPRDLLGEDLEHEGVSGAGTAPDTPRETAKPKGPAHTLASRADCESAARHLVELGVELAIREETDPERRKQLESQRAAAVRNDRARAHVASWTDECLQRETTQAEARCIARVQNEADIDRCVPR